MNDGVTIPKAKHAARFILSGRVQGLGVRPAIARLATQLGLTGSVSNQADGVHIFVEGNGPGLQRFESRLAEALPSTARIEQLTRVDADVEGYDEFDIDPGIPASQLSTEVPRDLAVCDDCLHEVASTGDRRYRYAFTSCTNCGPRYSIIDRMPYERDDTAMAEFVLCHHCREEFTSLFDHRFHAQTNACDQCGPGLVAVTHDADIGVTGWVAIEKSVNVLRAGGIVAMKGLGGYQLLCDAGNADAVYRIRQGKRRPTKPLAVMLDAKTANLLSGEDRRVFLDSTNPIIVLTAENAARLLNDESIPVGSYRAESAESEVPRRSAVTALADNLTLGLNTLGVLSPTTPLHALLLNSVGGPLVVTSGNSDGEPLAYENDSALKDLLPIADLVLQHDRQIVRPVDDSVVRVIADRPVTIRAARGIAPLPLPFNRDAQSESTQMLAVGGNQKSAVALCNGRQSILGPHVGDLDSIAARERYKRQVSGLLELYQADPEAIVCDLHPDYFTTQWAEQRADGRGIPLIQVQHHHAHIASGMLEHGWLDEKVLGVAFDGTGYGMDGSIWGGEFLLATATTFCRAASLRPFTLPGGEQAIRQPWRVAVSLATQAFDDDESLSLLGLRVSSKLVGAANKLARRTIGPQCSSMGRLFDGVAAIILGLDSAQFEGEPAMLLEAACDPRANGMYDIPFDESAEVSQLDWRPLIRQLCSDRNAGTPVGTMAMKFHRAIAKSVSFVAKRFDAYPVVLGGGCFQNRILTEEIADRLYQHPRPVGLPRIIPPNDGGLAAGQLAIGLARLEKSKPESSVPMEEVSCA